MSTWLAGRADPPQPLRWAARAVWAACDGSLAAITGTTVQADGFVGTYLTLWQRQGDGGYRWVYHASTPDVPQPPPRTPLPEVPGEDVIVVPGIDAIEGRTADCPVPAPPRPSGPIRVAIPPGPGPEGRLAANDGTLAFGWQQGEDGRWQLLVEWQRGGNWQVALRYMVPAGDQGG